MQLISPADAAGRVTAALKGAAEATGAGFDYLLRTAKRESALDPTAQSAGSSARGLFQFIDQTWLQVLKEEGPKLGLGVAAQDVSKSAGGRYVVSDPARKAELLAMRDDPRAAALLAGALTRRNAAALTASLGRDPSEGELYAAHFLGAQGAAQLVTLAEKSPSASAADAFPVQAAANRTVFFDQGRARTAAEVYAKVTATPSSTPSAAPAPVAASASQAPVKVAAQRWVVEGAGEPAPYNNGVEDDQSAFHSMFKTGRRAPVSAYVAQAWSSFSPAGLAADAAAPTFAAQAGKATREVAAAAYAAQPRKAVQRTEAAQSAAEAVTAAARKPRAKTATAKPAALAYSPPVAETQVAASRETSKPRLDLGGFLRSILAPSETPATKRGGKP